MVNSNHIFTVPHVIVPPSRGKDPRNGQNDARERTYTVDESIDLIGVGWLHYKIFLACGFCLMGVIMDTLGMSIVIPPAVCDLELDTFRKGILTGVSFLGIMVSSHVWGFITDTYGRRSTMIWSLCISVLLSAISAMVANFWLLVALRLFSGMGMAGCASILYVYLGEFNSDKSRSWWIIAVCTFVALAMLIFPCTGYGLEQLAVAIPITQDYIIHSWRLQMLVNVVPGLISILILRSLPESPKFLMSAGKEKKALAALQKMFVVNTGKSVNEFPVERLQMTVEDLTQQHTDYNKKSFKGFCQSLAHETVTLFRPPYLLSMLSCCYIQAAIYIIASGLGLWYPELTNRLTGSAEGEASRLCDLLDAKKEAPFIPLEISNLTIASVDVIYEESITSACIPAVTDKMYIDSIMLGLGYVFCYCIIFSCMMKMSVKQILVLFLFLTGASGFVLPSLQNAGMLVSFVFFLMFSGTSISMINTLTVQLFPTHLRGMAMSITNVLGRLSTFTSANVLGFLFDYNCMWTIYGLAAIISLACLISWRLPNKPIGRE